MSSWRRWLKRHFGRWHWHGNGAKVLGHSHPYLWGHQHDWFHRDP